MQLVQKPNKKYVQPGTRDRCRSVIYTDNVVITRPLHLQLSIRERFIFVFSFLLFYLPVGVGVDIPKQKDKASFFKGGKFLKKLWGCVGGKYYKIMWFYQLG